MAPAARDRAGGRHAPRRRAGPAGACAHRAHAAAPGCSHPAHQYRGPRRRQCLGLPGPAFGRRPCGGDQLAHHHHQPAPGRERARFLRADAARQSLYRVPGLRGAPERGAPERRGALGRARARCALDPHRLCDRDRQHEPHGACQDHHSGRRQRALARDRRVRFGALCGGACGRRPRRCRRDHGDERSAGARKRSPRRHRGLLAFPHERPFCGGSDLARMRYRLRGRHLARRDRGAGARRGANRLLGGALGAAVAGEDWRAELARHHWVDTYMGAAATRAFLDAERGVMRGALSALGLLAAPPPR